MSAPCTKTTVNMQSMLALLHSLQETITSASMCDAGGVNVGKTKVEALATIGQVIHDNGGQLPVDEVSSLMSFLLRLIADPVTPGRRQPFRSSSGSDSAVWVRHIDDDMEVQRLAYVAIGVIFSRAGPAISNITWKSTVQALRAVIESVASKTPLTEDADSSRYYAALLRCLHLVLSDPKGSDEEHVLAYLGPLRMFLMYGLSNSTGKAYRTSTEKEASAYRPPHLRGKLKSYVQTSGGNTAMLDEAELAWGFSSDSDQSDSDGSIGENDRFKSSKCRTNAIMIIQALARTDPKSLHAHWALLFPTHNVLQPRPYQATLLTTLLFDPIIKARVAAASTVAVMLEGPVRPFLQVAEHRELARTGPFTTLSGSLGQIVIQLHTGLVHVVLNEKQSGVLVVALKALSLLVAAAPFNRLPAELLSNVVLSVCKRIRELFSSSVDQGNTMCAAINCLGTALSATPASNDVATFLSTKLPTAGPVDAAKAHSLLLDLFTYAQPPAPVAVRIEAFQALKAAVHNYSVAVVSFWDQIFGVVVGVIDLSTGGCSNTTEAAQMTLSSFAKSVQATSSTQTARLSDDKLVQCAIKLLDELLRTISGFEASNELYEEGLLKPPLPSLLPKPLKLLRGPIAPPASKAIESNYITDVEKCKDGCSQWLLALEDVLPKVLPHSAPMVRGAALTCFAGLTPAVFCGLPEQKQEFILSAVVHASEDDDTPAVRSAACRAIGVIVGFPPVLKCNEKVTQIINLVLPRLEDASASVRITASWAVANLCDALRSNMETVDLKEADQILKGIPLAHLAECTFKAVKNGDKVRANAVRALGNLARFVDFSSRPFGPGGKLEQKSDCEGHNLSRNSQIPASEWLGTMVQTFMSSVTTGNVKVQWNVCHALGNLFLNRSIQLSTASWAPSVFSVLLLLLRSSTNFKIRIHTASALSVPESREDYGVAFGDVVQTLVHSLESVDADVSAEPTSFKYQAALKDQLTSTALHVLALGHPQDFTLLKDTLVKRASFLHMWLSTLLPVLKRGMPCSIDTLQKAAFGTSRMAVTTVEYDEKPLPPPGYQRGYSYEDVKSTSGGDSEHIFNRLVDAERAVKALSAMYMYGGSVSTSKNLENLMCL